MTLLAGVTDLTERHEDCCLLWLGSAESRGRHRRAYPSVYLDGKRRSVRRLLCEASPLTPELRPGDALHVWCGTAMCVEPGHLYVTRLAGRGKPPVVADGWAKFPVCECRSDVEQYR